MVNDTSKRYPLNVGSMEAPPKAFLLFFLLPDWLKLSHLKTRMEWGLSDIFSLHICSNVAETIVVTNYAASLGAKNVQKTTFEAAEMMLGLWNQQIRNVRYSRWAFICFINTSADHLKVQTGGPAVITGGHRELVTEEIDCELDYRVQVLNL